MNYSMKIGLVKATLFSILIALSGMAAIASADEEMPIVNMFYGNVTLNGADAPLETVINAYIDEELRGSSVIDETDGKYCIAVVGNGSVDGGRVVTFKVCGAAADQTVVWLASYQSRPLDLTAVDDEAPAVTDATATPSSIVANGDDTTQLNVTVIDGCGVGSVTVNLSAIGGSAVQAMAPSGGDTYSTDATASVGTAPGTYYLHVNASDGLGNCNTSVCIELVIEPTTTLIGDINGDCKVDYIDLGMLGASYGLSSGDAGYNAAADLNDDNAVNFIDLGMLGAHYGEMC